jgi:hypothetical protein
MPGLMVLPLIFAMRGSLELELERGHDGQREFGRDP